MQRRRLFRSTVFRLLDLFGESGSSLDLRALPQRRIPRLSGRQARAAPLALPLRRHLAATWRPAAWTWRPTLVERFDIEPYSDFSAKLMKLSNFTRLILFCIDAKFFKKIFVGKLLTRSTRFTCFCTAQTSIFQKQIVIFFSHFSANVCKNSLFLNSSCR